MSFLQETSPSIQQCLQFILLHRPESWTYSILWQPAKDVSNGCPLILSWGDGHFLPNSSTKPGNTKLNHPKIDPRQEIQSLLHHDHDWFYTISLTRTFPAGEGVIGRAFSSGSVVWLAGDQELHGYECERVKEARVYGIRTLVCIPTSCGVVELGSSEVINQDWTLVQLAKSWFGPGITSVVQEPRLQLIPGHAKALDEEKKDDSKYCQGRSSSDSDATALRENAIFQSSKRRGMMLRNVRQIYSVVKECDLRRFPSLISLVLDFCQLFFLSLLWRITSLCTRQEPKILSIFLCYINENLKTCFAVAGSLLPWRQSKRFRREWRSACEQFYGIPVC